MCAEVSSLRRVDAETARLYRILQESVDRQIEQVGFLPDATRYGMIVGESPEKNGPTKPQNGSRNGHSTAVGEVRLADDAAVAWGCSEKQRALIERVAKEQKFAAEDIDGIADRLFKLPVQRLDKKQASDFIAELLAVAGPAPRYRRTAKSADAPISVNAYQRRPR